MNASVQMSSHSKCLPQVHSKPARGNASAESRTHHDLDGLLSSSDSFRKPRPQSPQCRCPTRRRACKTTDVFQAHDDGIEMLPFDALDILFHVSRRRRQLRCHILHLASRHVSSTPFHMSTPPDYPSFGPSSLADMKAIMLVYLLDISPPIFTIACSLAGA